MALTDRLPEGIGPRKEPKRMAVATQDLRVPAKRPGSARDPLWYKDALIYQVHVRTYSDSNGDGIGDFPGLTAKLDYIQRLGVNCIWLLPFYPSPLKDDGYDIAHYEGVHPAYGTLKDFKTFLREAHERDIQVITELVINHTSDQHPWFQAARKAPADSSKRAFYVWSDTPHKYEGVRIIFQDTEKSNWTWDAEANAYFWHRFFSHQPDLNFDNERVRRAVLKVMKFWMDMGVDGLRLDAVPYLVERDGTICENLPETHDILKEIRRELDARYDNRMLLAEANQWPADVRPYFGDGDECQMAFHFPLMPRLFMAVRQEDRYPITEVLRQTPDIPDNCQWATFLRNHDELTLEMVTNEERDYMWQQYAADPQMRLNQGIRRRLAPLMENNRQRIELLNSLLFSLPGTPVIYYGDEIGMGDNVYLGDRNGVRTPMQWTGDRNAGFSTADPHRLYAPPVMDPVYNFQGLNVEAQERSPFSLLNWMKRLIAVRRQHNTFGRGSLQFLEPENRKVLAYIRRTEAETILCVANVSRAVQGVSLDLSAFAGRVPVEMLDRTEFPRIGTQPFFVTLCPYGFYWFQLIDTSTATATTRVAPRLQGATIDTLPPLLVGPVWDQILDGHVRVLLEREYLLAFLTRQRWFTATVCGTPRIRIEDWITLKGGRLPVFLLFVAVECTDGSDEHYAIPLATADDHTVDTVLREIPQRVLARITGARAGVLYETLPDDAALSLLGTAERQRALRTHGAVIQGAARPFFAAAKATLDPNPRITRPVDPHHVVVVIGEQFVLKLLRKVEPAPHQSVEVQEHITGPAGWGRVPRVAGQLDYVRRDGSTKVAGVIHEYLVHQRNAWDHSVEEAQRFFDRALARPQDAPGVPALPEGLPSSLAALAEAPVPLEAFDTIGGFIDTAITLGKRIAEMHLAFARPSDDPVFGVRPSGDAAFKAVAEETAKQARVTLSVFKDRIEQIQVLPSVAEEAWIVAENEDALIARVRTLAEEAGPPPASIRIHGDLHLGQILLHQHDALIFDFEGDPARPLQERRAHQSVLRDLAGMVESFRYAAYAGLFSYTATRPGDFDRLEPWARFWIIWTSVVFLRAYRSVIGTAPFLPETPEAFVAGLSLFISEQALRDLENELRYRPEWLRVPLGTLTRVLGKTEA
jgi:maltose alpha-D-glucosyltransferase/alpha-amylase